MKIALVHDWLNQIGGAEDVLEALKGAVSRRAQYYTSIYTTSSRMPAQYRDWDIRTLWMDRICRLYMGGTRAYLPLVSARLEQPS